MAGLLIAGRQVPSAEQLETIKSFTSLVVEFQLTTQQNFQQLQGLL